jgi:hypothetical protein
VAVVLVVASAAAMAEEKPIQIETIHVLKGRKATAADKKARSAPRASKVALAPISPKVKLQLIGQIFKEEGRKDAPPASAPPASSTYSLAQMSDARGLIGFVSANEVSGGGAQYYSSCASCGLTLGFTPSAANKDLLIDCTFENLTAEVDVQSWETLEQGGNTATTKTLPQGGHVLIPYHVDANHAPKSPVIFQLDNVKGDPIAVFDKCEVTEI